MDYLFLQVLWCCWFVVSINYFNYSTPLTLRAFFFLRVTCFYRVIGRKACNANTSFTKLILDIETKLNMFYIANYKSFMYLQVWTPTLDIYKYNKISNTCNISWFYVLCFPIIMVLLFMYFCFHFIYFQSAVTAPFFFVFQLFFTCIMKQESFTWPLLFLSG